MEIFYIEEDRWMTGGATRGQGGEIITKIEESERQERKREKDYNFTPWWWIDWQLQKETEGGRRGAGDERNRRCQTEREKESMFEGKYGEKVLARGDENVKKQTQLIHFSHVFLFHAPKSLYSINT